MRNPFPELAMERDLRGDALPEPRPPPGLSVRSFRAGDENAIASIYRICELAPGPAVETVESIRSDPAFRERILVADEGKEVVGTIAARDLPGERSASELLLLGVVPEWRATGAGRALVLALLEHERARGAQRVELVTYEDRIAAIRLYLRCGFRPLHRHPSDPARWRSLARDLGGPALPEARQERHWGAGARLWAGLLVRARSLYRVAPAPLRRALHALLFEGETPAPPQGRR